MILYIFAILPIKNEGGKKCFGRTRIGIRKPGFETLLERQALEVAEMVDKTIYANAGFELLILRATAFFNGGSISVFTDKLD